MRTHRLQACIVGVAVLLPACAPTQSTLPPGTCSPIPVSTEGWRLVDLGPFSMRVPPGFEQADVQPIDSRAGAFRRMSNGAEITYDYGLYSNELAPDTTVLTERVRCSDNIGGMSATIVVGERKGDSEAAGEYVVAGAWRNVERGDQPVHLTVWSTTRDATEIAMLREVLQSVRFEGRE